METEKNLRNQIINWQIVNEYLSPDRSSYIRRCRHTLSQLGIEISEPYISMVKSKLVSGERSPEFPTNFSGRLGSRYSKDIMYAELWRTADIALGQDNLVYWGLPAYNIEVICRKIGDRKRVTMCERDKGVVSWVHDFYKRFLETTSLPRVENTDIFHSLTYKTEEAPNVFDFDLMCSLKNAAAFDLWAQLIAAKCSRKCVVNLTTCVGRSTTNLMYESLMPHSMTNAFRRAGFKEIEVFRGKYRDRVVPIRYEHFLLEK